MSACRCFARGFASSGRGCAADVYDDRLVEAVTAFQEKSGLTADGILGPRTLRR